MCLHTHCKQWRQRHVVFKITHSGRLRLIVYKELPAVPANEAKEIQIEQFGGLETNFKLDNEKYLFAIVTNCATDCFSAETPQEMSDWTTVLQEYLGKGDHSEQQCLHRTLHCAC